MSSNARQKYVKTLHSQRGQGVIELLLLLSISTFLILGMLYQFSDAFRKWSANYFGNYLTCLIEAGELPGPAGQGGICSQNFKAFTLTDGVPLIAGAGIDGPGMGAGYQPPGGSSGSGGSGGSGNSGGSNGNGGANNGNGSNGGNPGGGGANAGNRGGSRGDGDSNLNGDTAVGETPRSNTIAASASDIGGGNTFGGTNRFDAGEGILEPNSASKTASSDEIEVSAADQFSNAAGGGGLGGANSSQRLDRAQGRLRYVEMPADETDKQDNLAPKTVEASANENSRTRGSRLPADSNVSDGANVKEVDLDFSLPNIFRWLVVAVLILIFIFVIGNQLSAIQQARKKS